MSDVGKVYLIGAGPGDEGLLTVKAQRLLASAQVVVHDRLIGPDILAHIPDQALKIDVGKHAGSHPVPQEEINRILVEQAQSGRDVIRLKGGDCFVFGRGGEELEELCAAGIPFEVVPGVTSALAAPAYAGIPVTHRRMCSSVHIITGHVKKGSRLDLDYEALVRLKGTLVFLMSVANAEEITQGLIRHGMDPQTSSAMVENGTLPCQRKVLAPLCQIAAQSAAEHITSPAILLVGQVCGFSQRFDWFSTLPLHGRRVLVTRPKQAASRLVDGLKALGAEVRALPAISTRALAFTMPDLTGFDALVFTSATGANAFFDRLLAQGQDARALSGQKIAAVGKQTAAALLSRGLRADFVPTQYSGRALAGQMAQGGFVRPGQRLLLLRAAAASPDLPQELDALGVAYEETPVYETALSPSPGLDLAEYDAVTLTSASCVDSLAAARPQGLASVRAFCIGPRTAQAAREHGLTPIVAPHATIDAMLSCMAEYDWARPTANAGQ